MAPPKTSQFVNGSDQSLHDHVILGGRKDLVEGRITNDARHDTLLNDVSLSQ